MSALDDIGHAIANDPTALRALEDREVECSECRGTGMWEAMVPCSSGSRGLHARCCGGDGVVERTGDCRECLGEGHRVKCGRCATERPPRMLRIDKRDPSKGSRLMTCSEWAGCEGDE